MKESIFYHLTNLVYSLLFRLQSIILCVFCVWNHCDFSSATIPFSCLLIQCYSVKVANIHENGQWFPTLEQNNLKFETVF